MAGINTNPRDPLAQAFPPAGDLPMGSHKITGLATPTSDADAATKKYVDDNAGGGGGKLLGYAFARDTTVRTAGNTVPADNTVMQNTEGVELFTINYTPTAATSTLRISVEIVFTADNNQVGVACGVFRDSDADAIGFGIDCSSTMGNMTSFHFSFTAPAVSATAQTFKVRAGTWVGQTLTFNGSGGSHYFGSVMGSNITIEEWAA